jgi:methyltransferase (TIGR00027 family)
MPTPTQPSKTASATAQATAFMRALAASAPKTEIQGKDHLAEIFLDEEQKKPLKDAQTRAWVMQNRLAPGAYEFMLARTAYFDQLISQAFQDQVPQVVFLGAGYDSRPYRFQEQLHNTKVFELDSAPTLQRKQDCLQQAGVAIPRQVVYVAVNLESEGWAGKLQKASFQPEKKSLFIWEGVTYYLSASVVDGMLKMVRSISAPGSSISFDYASLSPEALEEKGAKDLRQVMKTHYVAEPIQFGIRSGTLETYLTERGFQVKTHLNAAEMTARYLAKPDVSGLGKAHSVSAVLTLFCLVEALVS